MSEYPEHDKLQALEGRNQIIGEFLEWLMSREYVIGAYHKHSDGCRENGKQVCGYSDWDPQLVPINKPIEVLLADYFGIDRDKLESENRALLATLRNAHG